MTIKLLCLQESEVPVNTLLNLPLLPSQTFDNIGLNNTPSRRQGISEDTRMSNLVTETAQLDLSQLVSDQSEMSHLDPEVAHQDFNAEVHEDIVPVLTPQVPISTTKFASQHQTHKKDNQSSVFKTPQIGSLNVLNLNRKQSSVYHTPKLNKHGGVLWNSPALPSGLCTPMTSLNAIKTPQLRDFHVDLSTLGFDVNVADGGLTPMLKTLLWSTPGKHQNIPHFSTPISSSLRCVIYTCT